MIKVVAMNLKIIIKVYDTPEKLADFLMLDNTEISRIYAELAAGDESAVYSCNTHHKPQE